MITDKIQNQHRYMGISSNLDIALDYLMAHDFRSIDEHLEINGNDVYINKQTPTLVPFSDRAWENHFSYIDIHVAIEGSEILAYLNDPDNLHWSDVNIRRQTKALVIYGNGNRIIGNVFSHMSDAAIYIIGDNNILLNNITDGNVVLIGKNNQVNGLMFTNDEAHLICREQ